MKSWTPPKADQIKKLAVLAARPEARAYFFDRLENPEWVRPLSETGFFDNPPDPVPAAQPGYVKFPPWHEGRYLARMAERAPDEVANVLSGVATSENPAVTRLLLEAMASLPTDRAADLADRVLSWVKGPHADFFADDAATVVIQLISAGDAELAIDVADALLEVLPDPKLVEKRESADGAFRLPPEPSSRMSEWEYERVADRLVPPLVEGAGMEAVRLFMRLLDQALQLSVSENEAAAARRIDHSYIWRPAIEDHSQNTDRGIKNVLVDAVRDAALSFASQGPDELRAVIQELEQGSTLFERIVLHVLAATRNGEDLVAQRLLDRERFDDHRIRHEYANLLRARFQDVDDETRAAVIGWIESGPDLDWYRGRRLEIDGVETSEDEVQRYAEIWRRDRFSFIADGLEGELAERYRGLVEDYGEPDHPDFITWSSSWVGTESPVSREELLEMEPSSVADFVRSWSPDDESGWHRGPSIEGLGRVLNGIVASKHSEYALAANSFEGADPTYVREYFSGLELALGQEGTFDWEGPLRLALWVARLPFEADEEVEWRDRDPGFRWCRRRISSLLKAGFSTQDNTIPFALRVLAWETLARLVQDPNPSEGHEDRYGGENMDSFTLSLNTNRGEAVHAVIEYALWVHRSLEASGVDTSHGFEVMDEVRDVLNRHLDVTVEPSHAVRAVYGRWLPWLILIDEAWVSEKLNSLFPTNEGLAEYAETTWSTYVTWCSPYDSVFRVLRGHYEAAVQNVPSGVKAGNAHRTSIDEKLGEHLVTFYWRGLVDMELMKEFFNRADDELAARVLAHVGRALRNTPGELSDQIRERIEELFEWRLAVGESSPDEHSEELRAFGIWFSSGKLGQDWALEMLRKTVELAGSPTLGHWAVERLVDIATNDPTVAVELLAGMLADLENDWDDLGWSDDARRILVIARDSGVAEARRGISEIVDHYVRRGNQDFREFA
jgi:hypothetical protein